MSEERLKADFDRLVKDALNSLYDYAALEVHPLGSILPNVGAEGDSRAHGLHDVLTQAIEALRPPATTLPDDAMAWRPYRVLHGRYVERLNLKDLQQQLALSARQLRREHARSIEALAAMLWEKTHKRAYTQANERIPAEQALDESGLRTYDLRRERLDLTEIVQSVLHILRPRIEKEGATLSLSIPSDLPTVCGDRIILRQILLSLLNRALQLQTGRDISFQAQSGNDNVRLILEFRTDVARVFGEKTTSSETARYWARRLGARLQEDHRKTETDAVMRFTLAVPQAQQTTVLVVDDQQATIRMFRRYLSHFHVQVVGIRESESVLDAARSLQPQCITLDLMMPTIDGWEILQALQSDPETQHIPIIVCSVWNEPQLAFSLGATEYLRKPVTQKDLLEILEQLGLLDTSDEVSPANTRE